MSVIKFDPAVPVDVVLSFNSPQVVSYRLWRRPKDGSWTEVAHGTDSESVAVNSHQHQLTIAESDHVKYRLLFEGNANTDVAAQIRFQQNGSVLSGGLIHETGKTDVDGVLVRSREVGFESN